METSGYAAFIQQFDGCTNRLVGKNSNSCVQWIVQQIVYTKYISMVDFGKYMDCMDKFTGSVCTKKWLLYVILVFCSFSFVMVYRFDTLQF